MATKRKNPKYGIGRKAPFTSRIRGREFEARDYEHAKKKAQRLAQRTGKDYYVWDHPSERNPNLIHHSIGYPTKAEAEKAKRKLGHGKVRKAGGWWYVVGPKANPRQRKTQDVWVVQGNYGYGHGWEDLTAEETYREARQRLREYNENEPQSPHRLKLRREKIVAKANPGPSAIPTRWTKATVYRAGKKIMAKIGGR